MSTIPGVTFAISLLFFNFCYPQSIGTVRVSIDSARDGTFSIYNSHFVLMDSSSAGPDIPIELSFEVSSDDFYFVAIKKGNKVFRLFFNFYLKPGDNLHISDSRGGLKLEGNAADLNNFSLDSKYPSKYSYRKKSYFLEPTEVSVFLDSIRYTKEKYLSEFVLEKGAPALFQRFYKEQIYQEWCADYMDYMYSHSHYAHDILRYLPTDSLAINFKDSLRFNSEYNYSAAYSSMLKSYIEMRFHETTAHLSDSLKYEFPMRSFFELIASEYSRIDREIAYEAFASELAFRMRDVDQELYLAVINPALELMTSSKSDYLKYSFTTQYNALKKILAGEIAPNFTLKDLYDKDVSLSDFRGKIVYLNFWGTWCPPCIASVPKQIEIQRKYEHNKDIVFLNIALEYGVEDIERWKNFVKEKGYNGIHLVAEKQFNNESLTDYMLNTAPTYMIIGKSGEIIKPRTIPPYANEEVIHKLLSGE